MDREGEYKYFSRYLILLEIALGCQSEISVLTDSPPQWISVNFGKGDHPRLSYNFGKYFSSNSLPRSPILCSICSISFKASFEGLPRWFSRAIHRRTGNAQFCGKLLLRQPSFQTQLSNQVTDLWLTDRKWFFDGHLTESILRYWTQQMMCYVPHHIYPTSNKSAVSLPKSKKSVSTETSWKL